MTPLALRMLQAAAGVGGGGGASPSLTRSSSGLLFEDEFNRSDGALGSDWDVVSGGWAISSNEVASSSGADGDLVKVDSGAMSAVADMVVQAQVRRGTGYIGIIGRWISDGDGYYLVCFNDHTLYDLGAGSNIFQDGASASATNYRYKVACIGTNISAVVNEDFKATISNSGVSGTGVAGARCGGNGSIYFDDFAVYSARTITCSGLSNGYSIKLTDASSNTFTAPSIGGTATLDTLRAHLPGSQLEIVNQAGTNVATYNSADIWGGDAFAGSDLPALSVTNYGVYFDGSADYGHASLASTSTASMTLEARVFINGPADGIIAHVGDADTGWGFGIARDSVGNEGVHLVGLYSNVRWIDTNVELTNGWHMISMVLNASGHPTFYIDGVSVYSDSSGGPNSPTNNIYVGSEGGSGRYAPVLVDELRYWDAARSQGGIAGDYDAELVGNEANLVGCWKMNEGSGSSVADDSSNSNDMTLVSSPVWAAGMDV